jgi:hypothetical protein
MQCGSPVASPDKETQIQNGRAVNFVMAKVIEFYIPTRFQKRVAWVPPEERGKVIEFYSQVKKSA